MGENRILAAICCFGLGFTWTGGPYAPIRIINGLVLPSPGLSLLVFWGTTQFLEYLRSVQKAGAEVQGPYRSGTLLNPEHGLLVLEGPAPGGPTITPNKVKEFSV